MSLRWKIIIAIALAFLAVYSFGAPVKPKAAGCSVVPVMDQVELQAWYKDYNHRYFGNSLAPAVVIQWEDMHDRKRMGETDCKAYPCIIKLDPTYNLAFPTAKATLLHELCHVKVYDEKEDHGRRWHACMDGLWESGAFDGLV
jgi:hypothetical protein